ncbi:hypothetical protein [Synechococcus sp. CS-1332]|uniref:hypothetical protein n=1 Tax=Synechococcus sp. CS-1332 TaxID=2847972 RepID=UPI00223C0E77|nr:hypothetical protein [Synechococcus sp. CS-1332]MCT0206442.1 hypothetical protein [Synechococcus sp. CS-1332]
MLEPTCYNIPPGKTAREILSDDELNELSNQLEKISQFFEGKIILYKIDVGKTYRARNHGKMVLAGRFVETVEGEIHKFYINPSTGEVYQRSLDECLLPEVLESLISNSSPAEAKSPEAELPPSYQSREEFLTSALFDEESSAYKTTFAWKLREGVEALGILHILMDAREGSREMSLLYVVLFAHTVQLTIDGLNLHLEHRRSGSPIEHDNFDGQECIPLNVDSIAKLIKEHADWHCCEAGLELGPTFDSVPEAIRLAREASQGFIEKIVRSPDYRIGDVAITLLGLITDYCPVEPEDMVEVDDYELDVVWQEVVAATGCAEQLAIDVLIKTERN